jgi:predicted transcriptional regulator
MNFARRAIMPIMRTTLEIDDDVLQAVKEIAARRKTTGTYKGEVVIADDFDDPVDPEAWR